MQTNTYLIQTSVYTIAPASCAIPLLNKKYNNIPNYAKNRPIVLLIYEKPEYVPTYNFLRRYIFVPKYLLITQQ